MSNEFYFKGLLIVCVCFVPSGTLTFSTVISSLVKISATDSSKENVGVYHGLSSFHIPQTPLLNSAVHQEREQTDLCYVFQRVFGITGLAVCVCMHNQSYALLPFPINNLSAVLIKEELLLEHSSYIPLNLQEPKSFYASFPAPMEADMAHIKCPMISV